METTNFLGQLTQQMILSAPLFSLIALGYCLGRFAGWPEAASGVFNRFCFSIALPCMLFKVMSKFYQSPPVDMRLLIAYFGSCLLIYIVGRIVAKACLALMPSRHRYLALGVFFPIT
jgi:predicted permease